MINDGFDEWYASNYPTSSSEVLIATSRAYKAAYAVQQEEKDAIWHSYKDCVNALSLARKQQDDAARVYDLLKEELVTLRQKIDSLEPVAFRSWEWLENNKDVQLYTLEGIKESS